MKIHLPPKQKTLVGAHMSIAQGVHFALLRGADIHATVIQIFTANQRKWSTDLIPEQEVELWEKSLETTEIQNIMSHASYLINLGAHSEETERNSIRAFQQEITRCHQLHIDYLNFHPGSSTGWDSREECLDRIIKNLLLFEKQCARGNTRLILETTAGQGNYLGKNFAELNYIISQVKQKVPIGVCIDTCHVFASGMDIRTSEGFDEMLEKFDTTIGLEHLHAFHVSDSQEALGSNKDRHASLGEGEIGLDAFRCLMKHPKLKSLPKYLETPKPELWSQEIDLLKGFAR